MFGQHRQTARKERTCLLILGMSGVNRFIGVYRVISGRERKRTQVLWDFSRGTSAIFVNVPQFIVFYPSFYRQPHTHERPPTDTRRLGGRSSLFRGGLGCLPSRIGYLPVCSGLHRVYFGRKSGVSEYTPDGLPFIGSQSGLNRDYIGSYCQYLVTSGVFRDKNR